MKIERLFEKGDATAQLVRATLNILMESPYFYKEDDERAFLTVLRHRQTFDEDLGLQLFVSSLGMTVGEGSR